MREKLKEICEWLNNNYNQETENYNIFFGSKPGVIKYDEHTAISPWACGAIVCIEDILYFIAEDDGNWWINEEKNTKHGDFGYLTKFSIAWGESFIDALKTLKDYVFQHGTPIYFSGTDTICHYTL